MYIATLQGSVRTDGGQTVIFYAMLKLCAKIDGNYRTLVELQLKKSFGSFRRRGVQTSVRYYQQCQAGVRRQGSYSIIT